MLQIERYLKQAIVDKSPVVASAALVSALHLLANNTEIVKRWINEIQEAAQNKNHMVQVSNQLHTAAHTHHMVPCIRANQPAGTRLWRAGAAGAAVSSRQQI